MDRSAIQPPSGALTPFEKAVRDALRKERDQAAERGLRAPKSRTAAS
jgi:hypothetical protein